MYFVTFWAGHLALPITRKVDASIATYAQKKIKTPGDGLIAMYSASVDAGPSPVQSSSSISDGAVMTSPSDDHSSSQC